MKCKNHGCGKEFNEDENSETACEYHSSGPIFHEGLKGWGCCNKRVVDFDEFMQIPGCTLGRHVVEIKDDVESVKNDVKKDIVPEKVVNGTTEVYGTIATPPTKVEVDTPEPKPTGPKEEELNDAEDAVIATGSKCLRKGCSCVYTDASTKQQECVFHPGAPIFHEGSKGWSCCKRRVLEFDEFLQIKGCTTGKHRFTQPNVPVTKSTVECRNDFFQSPTTLTVNFYAKKVDKTKTTVTFFEQEMNVNIQFLDGQVYQWSKTLQQPIIPGECKYEVLSTKVEIILKKANGLSWSALSSDERGQGFITFGSATKGTVGGKSYNVVQDLSPALMK